MCTQQKQEQMAVGKVLLLHHLHVDFTALHRHLDGLVVGLDPRGRACSHRIDERLLAVYELERLLKRVRH